MSDITTAGSGSAPEQRRAPAPVLFNPMTTAQPSSPSPAASVFAENHKPKEVEMNHIESAYMPSTELLAAAEAAELAKKRITRLTEQVDIVAVQIKSIHTDVEKLSADLAKQTAELVMADDADVKKLEAAETRMSKELDEKQRTQTRLKAKIKALEDMAPELDEEVKSTIEKLQTALWLWLDGVRQSLGIELAEASKPLLELIAKARALGEIEFKDFLEAAWLPDPSDFKRQYGGHDQYFNTGTNLLARAADSEKMQEAADLKAALAPVRRLIQAGKYHGKYVSLAQREALNRPSGPPKGRVVLV